MKKTFFDKTIIGLVLAVFASVALAAGAVVANTPTQAPSAGSYVSPTFKGVTIKDSLYVGGGDAAADVTFDEYSNVVFNGSIKAPFIYGFEGIYPLSITTPSPSGVNVFARTPSNGLNSFTVKPDGIGLSVTNGFFDIMGPIKNTGTTNNGAVRIDDSLSLGSPKGILMDSGIRPIITSNYSPFTSGTYSGVGSYGLFKENYSLAFGIPNFDVSTTYFDFKTYAADSTGTTLMRLSNTGILDMKSTVIKNTNISGETAVKIDDELDVKSMFRALSSASVSYVLNVDGEIRKGAVGGEPVKINDDLEVTGKIAGSFDKETMFQQFKPAASPYIIAIGEVLAPTAQCAEGYFPIGCGFKSSRKDVRVYTMYIYTNPSTGISSCLFEANNTGTVAATFTPYANCLKGN
ncbi:MAG: hypothetical protein PHP74_00480 [Candidatus Gracilibacteria bacterium]|nr:hypothetical protein [Candidatus Gracilibacteria bacterium]